MSLGWAWGEVPTWLAFGAATVAATATWRTLIRQQRGDEARAELAKREQANKVTAWLVNEYEHQIDIPDEEGIVGTDWAFISATAAINPCTPSSTTSRPATYPKARSAAGC